MSTALLKYDAARKALAEAHRVDEAKDIRDKALAVAAYARQAQDRDMILWATEIKLRAERRTGELLREMDHPAGPGRGKKNMSANGDKFSPPLKKLGISRDQSSDWQKLAAIPAPEFDKRIKAASGDPASLTTAKMLRPVAAPITDDPFKEQREAWASVSGWLGRVTSLPSLTELKQRARPTGGIRTVLRDNLDEAEEYITGLRRLRKEDWL